MSLLPHEQRVVEEVKELDAKREKLSAFMLTDTCKSLPEREQSLLEQQKLVMSLYSNILHERISLFKSK
jgi:hypothetical protein